MNYQEYKTQLIDCLNQVDESLIEKLVLELRALKNRKGRLFLVGVGGSAANCSHAVNDFRKICGIDAITPLDNVSELTAYINDEGYSVSLSSSLKTSNMNENDALMVLSVGGGGDEISVNISRAITLAKNCNVKVFGIVSRDGGFTKKNADICLHFLPKDFNMITPIAESLQPVFWHYLVNSI